MSSPSSYPTLVQAILAFLRLVARLVQAFDLFQFFGLAAFFGWLGYQKLHDDDIKLIPIERQPMGRRNLRLITDYFFISFALFGVSMGADYLATNPADIPNEWGQIIASMEWISFTLALGFLCAPMLVVRGLGWSKKTLGDINPPPISWTGTAVSSVALNTIFLRILIPRFSTLSILFQIVVGLCFVAYVSAFMWKYWIRSLWNYLIGNLLMYLPFFVLLISGHFPLQ